MRDIGRFFHCLNNALSHRIFFLCSGDDFFSFLIPRCLAFHFYRLLMLSQQLGTFSPERQLFFECHVCYLIVDSFCATAFHLNAIKCLRGMDRNI